MAALQTAPAPITYPRQCEACGKKYIRASTFQRHLDTNKCIRPGASTSTQGNRSTGPRNTTTLNYFVNGKLISTKTVEGNLTLSEMGVDLASMPGIDPQLLETFPHLR